MKGGSCLGKIWFSLVLNGLDVKRLEKNHSSRVEARFHGQNSCQTASVLKCFPEESMGPSSSTLGLLHVTYRMMALENPAWFVS